MLDAGQQEADKSLPVTSSTTTTIDSPIIVDTSTSSTTVYSSVNEPLTNLMAQQLDDPMIFNHSFMPITFESPMQVEIDQLFQPLPALNNQFAPKELELLLLDVNNFVLSQL